MIKPCGKNTQAAQFAPVFMWNDIIGIVAPGPKYL